MPIRPIDIMKTQEASQMRHMESQKAQHAQNQAGQSFQTMIKREQDKPVKATKTDNNEYRYDAKEKGNTSYNKPGSNQKKKEQEEKKDPKEPIKRGNIDILI